MMRRKHSEQQITQNGTPFMAQVRSECYPRRSPRRCRETMPERILSSRMVRRWKPIAGVNQFKAKSRWCAHGHQDVDAPSLKTFSPTPTTESLHLFLTLALACDLCLQFADVKNAFCQSDPMARPNGPIFAEV